MSRPAVAWLAFAVLAVATLWPLATSAQSWSDPQRALRWQSTRAPYSPGPRTIAAGLGNDPEPGAPMYLCRAMVEGSLVPGKWVKGNCNLAYGGREVVSRYYEIASGNASWRSFGNRNDRGLIQTGYERDGTPLYSCRVRYRAMGRDLGYQPGKIVAGGKCDIAYGGREIVVGWPFDALYVGLVGASATLDPSFPGPWPGRPMPLCKMSDSDVHLVNGTWAGPNCIPVDINGKPVPRTAEESRHAQQLTDPPPPPNQPRELCRKDDPGVSFTANGYAGPDCITSNVYGELATYGNATPEERARYKETTEPCQPGDAGVHVENGMLVGADCKSVPEAAARQDDANNPGEPTFGIRNGDQVITGTRRADDEQQQEAGEKVAEARAIAAGRAASEQDMKAADEQAAREKAAADEAAAKAAAEQKAAQDEQDRKDAEALKKAFEDQAAADKAAAEQKAAQEEKDRKDAEALKKAFEDQAEKQKAADEPSPPEEAPAQDEPASPASDSGGSD